MARRKSKKTKPKGPKDYREKPRLPYTVSIRIDEALHIWRKTLEERGVDVTAHFRAILTAAMCAE